METGATRTKEADEVSDAIEAAGFHLEDSQGEWSWVLPVPDDYALIVMEDELDGPPLKWDDKVSVRLFHTEEIEAEWEAQFPNVREFLEAAQGGAESLEKFAHPHRLSNPKRSASSNPSTRKLKTKLLR